MDQEQFRQKLEELLALAGEGGMSLEKSSVEQAFPDLNKETRELIFEYLRTKKIRIVSDGTAGEEMQALQEEEEFPPLSAAEEKFLAVYEAEMKLRNDVKPEEFLSSDPELFREKLTESLLPSMLDAARRMAGGEVLLQDLVQESSLALWLSVQEVDAGLYQKDPEAVRRKLTDAGCEAMRSLMAEQSDVHIKDRRLVQRVEEFSDDIEILKEEMGRKVYVDEAADFLNVTEEEIESILRLSGQTVSEEDPEDHEEGPSMTIQS